MQRKPLIHAWIFARGGSKGLPGKNIKPLRGKPLLAWAIEAARQSRHISEVFVSTDSPEIAEVARAFGAIVPFMRPAELATDQAPERLAWRHAIEWEQSQSQFPAMDVMVAVPVTTPLRTGADIDACVDVFLEGGADTVIGVTPSDRHPSFNMVTLDERRYARVAMPLEAQIHRRQDAPNVYNITTAAYVTTPQFVRETMVYMDGRVRACILPPPCGVDIDSEEDFWAAEAMLARAQAPAERAARSSVFDKLSLRGRVAVVTGGAGHLGRVMSAALAEAGAGVAVVDRDAEACRSLADELSRSFGVNACGLAVDLADEAEVRALPLQVAGRLGRIDVLVNNAAYVGTSGLTGWAVPFEQQSSDTWRKALEVNLTAVFNLTQASRELLAASGHGAIINIASIYGLVGPNLDLYEGTSMGNPAAYAASKGGLLQFTRWCATVLAPEIRVNAITPGGIFRNQSDSFVGRYVARTPLKRMAAESDFEGAIVYLASDLSAYVTGQNLVVDGGFTAW